MAEVPLRARDGSVRAVVVVDDGDYDELMRYRWTLRVSRTGKRYAQRSIPHVTTLLMHRVLMGLEIGDPREVDHIDGDGLNNQRSNLRLADNYLNAQNRRVSRNNKSGFRGVRLYKGRYRASAMRFGVRHRLGSYETAEEAGAAVAAFWAEHDPISVAS